MTKGLLITTSPLGTYPDLPLVALSAALTMNVSSAGSGDEFPASGNDLVVVKNINGSAQTITFTSVKDAFNRTGDITTYSIPAGTWAVFGPFKQAGWKQTDGYIYITTSHVDILIGVIALP